FKPNKIYKEDGIRLDFDDHWIHIRKSNTEPIIRLIVEAHGDSQAEIYMKKYKIFLNSLK
ncbi:MAG: phosphoglucosamine mutase, partial [Ignavibacteria bacterium]|nr:phosphoglucosamine mutase [Ignavibacteria bacterium]